MFEKGEKIKVTYIKKGKPVEYIATVVGDYDGFITINKGNYLSTIDRLNIINGIVNIETFNKGGEKMARGRKIDKETLLEECIKYGWNGNVAESIGDKYGLSKLTIQTYYGKWGIADLLAKERDKREVDVLKDEGKVEYEVKMPHSIKEEKAELKKVMTIYEGDIMGYEITKDIIKIRNKEIPENYIIVAREGLLKVISELQELVQSTKVI